MPRSLGSRGSAPASRGGWTRPTGAARAGRRWPRRTERCSASCRPAERATARSRLPGMRRFRFSRRDRGMLHPVIPTLPAGASRVRRRMERRRPDPRLTVRHPPGAGRGPAWPAVGYWSGDRHRTDPAQLHPGTRPRRARRGALRTHRQPGHRGAPRDPRAGPRTGPGAGGGDDADTRGRLRARRRLPVHRGPDRARRRPARGLLRQPARRGPALQRGLGHARAAVRRRTAPPELLRDLLLRRLRQGRARGHRGAMRARGARARGRARRC